MQPARKILASKEGWSQPDLFGEVQDAAPIVLPEAAVARAIRVLAALIAKAAATRLPEVGDE